MTDRIPGAPGRYQGNLSADALKKMQEGEPFAITLTRDDAPIVEGTPYSKASVLPNELAARLCPNLEDPAPKDAFTALSTDFIVAEGTSGKWRYRKWNSGVAECWSEGRIVLDHKFSSILSRTVTLPFPIMNPNISMTLPDITAEDTHKFFGGELTYSETHKDDMLYFFYTKESAGFTETDYAQIHAQIVGTWK